MNIIEALKQYSKKNGELKRCISRLKVINIKLDNWDKLKASSISDMPMTVNTEHGDKIGDNVCSREELEEEKLNIEIRIAHLNNFIIEIDSRIECLQDNHRYIIEKLYKDGMRFKVLYKKYNSEIEPKEYKSIQKLRSIAEKKLEEME